jgi:hypothetical protein
MKKAVSIVLVLSMIFTFSAVLPAPVCAGDSSDVGMTVLVGVLILAGAALVIGIPVAIISSASYDEEQAKQNKEFLKSTQSAYDSRVNRWSYDDMMMEMGKPTDVAEGDAIKIVTYDKRTTSVESNTEYQEGNILFNATSKTNSNSITSGSVWTFTFDKRTKKLIKWVYESYESNRLQEKIGGPR